MATAIADAVMAVLPFDQPDVDGAKLASLRLLEHRTPFKQAFVSETNRKLHPGASR
jgi:hypothetical protein